MVAQSQEERTDNQVKASQGIFIRLSQGSDCYTTGFRKSGKDGRKSCKTGNRMGLGRQKNHPVVPSQFYVNDLTTGSLLEAGL